MIVDTFYSGLHSNTQIMIDAASCRSLNNKTLNEVYDLIEITANNNYGRATDYHAKKGGIIETDIMASMEAKMAAMQKLFENMSVSAIQTPSQLCKLYSCNHATQECQVENPFAQMKRVNYMESF